IQPSGPFRASFQYQITLFGAAGLAVGKASGSTWQDFVEKRIFDPLGMKSACTTTTRALKIPDHATPHRKSKQGKIESMPWYEMAEPDPAGSVCASARDLAQFVRFQLGDGVWQGHRLVSAAQLGETHTPQMVIRRDHYVRLMNPDTVQLSYGLGWI